MERRSREPQAGLSRKHRPDYQIVLYMGLLMLVGLIVMYAIGPQRAHVLNYASGGNYSDSYFFTKQAVALVLALVAFGIMSKISFTWLQKKATLLLLIGLGSCVVLSVSAMLKLPFAPTVLGAARWFDFGALGSIQPAEFLKFAVVIFTAGLLAVRFREGKVNDRDATLLPIAALLFFLALLIIKLQNNMSTGVILVAIVFAMLFVAGLNQKIIAMIIAIGLVAGVVFILIAPHRISRVMTFLQGDATSQSDDAANHQARQAHIAIGSGGLLGVGIGNSVQATGYLPESTNDSIFAIMGETFGFVGTVTILALFTALLVRMLRVADHLSSMVMKLTVIGVFTWLLMHVLINVASMLGLMPLTGVTLPLVSFGGTSMVFIAGALGLVFQLSQYTVNDVRVEEGGLHEDSSSRRRVGRPRYANRSRAFGAH